MLRSDAKFLPLTAKRSRFWVTDLGRWGNPKTKDDAVEPVMTGTITYGLMACANAETACRDRHQSRRPDGGRHPCRR